MTIRRLIQPQIDAFLEKCVQWKSNEIQKCIDDLKAHGMNISAVASPPSVKFKLIRSFTSVGISQRDGVLVEVDDKLVEKLLRGERFHIVSESDKYVKKLEEKIRQKLPCDPVVSVILEGSLWKESSVKVLTVSGRSIKFVTKTIINHTKYGDKFFQFPTRIQKEDT